MGADLAAAKDTWTKAQTIVNNGCSSECGKCFGQHLGEPGARDVASAAQPIVEERKGRFSPGQCYPGMQCEDPYAHGKPAISDAEFNDLFAKFKKANTALASRVE